MNTSELADRLRALPWGESGVPAPLDKLLVTGLRRRVDGGAGRVAFQLLAALGISGWSTRVDLQSAVNAIHRTSQANGAYARAWRALRQADLYGTHRAFFGGRPAVIARLTDLGRTLLAQAGASVVPSEWDLIDARHRRADEGGQMPHTTAICLFLHHARVRGYATAACPSGDWQQMEPDALIQRDGHQIYVEVQRRGGAAWRRARKWRHQFELQGFAAICASSPQLAQELAAEAQVAQVARGYITDLASLARGAPAGLWTHGWRSQHGPLEAMGGDDAKPSLSG